MALLHSEQKSLGKPAPPFKLIGVDGQTYSQDSFKSAEVLVVLFICNHCPYVQAVEDRILALNQYFSGQPVQLIGICSNDPTNYPDDSPDKLKKRWLEKKYGFPYLIDDSQQTAKDFGAVCTPDIFVYDRDRKLAYHGRIDDHWQHPEKVTREELKAAITLLLEGKSPFSSQHPSMGCSIKWKS